ncbi:microcin C7 resistance protein MccF [Paenibacillus swuensis]|uniref:Microcin C7 resistance protein MccF n=1 Tax=Paenibacillus swuensis TaxID=1178515 RepID=A0A172TJJ0_9BACL|nr:S66 peptidase family protein [Paenibacillus swuensis]ANE47142.1 microcin C7 resistance protein MccF [Paenibacillus swuensis]
MKKPNSLKPKAKIAIISPSSGLPYLYPGIYELGLKHLQETLGFEIKEMPTARMSTDELYRNPKLRAQEINRCFEDPEIDGIITSIGGYESIRILPFLNTELIMNNPKFIMGFSDATTFLAYFNQLGLVTFYGPSVMAGLAQMKYLPTGYEQHLKSILFSNEYPYTYAPYSHWTEGYQDWSNLDTLGECQEFQDNTEGWKFLQGSQVQQGTLWGGCIEVLEFMKSTEYWPEPSFWQDRILFFETSEDKPSPMQVGYMLRNYGMQGIFQKINGILFGRPKDYSTAEKQELNNIILDIFKVEFSADQVPIVVDFDFGHTDPKFILPLGAQMQLDPLRNEIRLLESPFGSGGNVS